MPLDQQTPQQQVIIIGGGPSGLSAAYEVQRLAATPIVLERLDKLGGLARTENYNGYRFDLGGHRFYTKSKEIQDLWHEIMGADFLKRPRLSRIYYHNYFFYYPLRLFNTLRGLGLWESQLILLSYLRWHFFPYREEESFEHWVTNRFGQRLFRTFFQAYTEKVWGISCQELKADWAAQRIQDLSFWTVLRSMLGAKTGIRTLTESFYYPRLGPGMLWQTLGAQIESSGGEIRLNSRVEKIYWQERRITGIALQGEQDIIAVENLITSMPLSEFIKCLQPPPDTNILQAANKLRYRDFITVCLIVKQEHLFPDNWIYIHDPDVKVGRIQNFKNWSPEMVADTANSSLGLEYFCNQGDELWNMDDQELIELGSREIAQIGLAAYSDIFDAKVVRVQDAYPIYDTDYAQYLQTLREFISSLENVQTIGRNGLHRYNNQDHAMLTGMLAARSLRLGHEHDLWAVNADQEYHEEVREQSGESLEDLATMVLPVSFARIHKTAFACALGFCCGVLLMLLSLLAMHPEFSKIQAFLSLLGHYFPAYWAGDTQGVILGFAFGFISAFILGWSAAFLRNFGLGLYLLLLRKQGEQHSLRNLLDYI